MPVRRTPPHQLGITAVPGRVHVSPPYGPDERATLRGMFKSPARAPLARELEELGRRVGALLEAHGFPPALGFYEVDDPERTEPGAPGSWREAPSPDAAGGGPEGDAARTATARHPALLRAHEGTVPWLLAKALQRLAEVRAHLGGTRPLPAEDFARAIYQLSDLLGQAGFKLDHEDLILRAEQDADRRRLGGETTGGRKRAAAEPRREGWRAEARAIWGRRPELTIKRVAELINEGRARKGTPPAGVSTISQAISGLKPRT